MASINPLLEWAQQRRLAPEQVEALGRATGVLPDAARWREWLDRILLIFGALLLAAGLIFFVAANWSGMGKVARFVLAQGALLAGVFVYVWHGDSRLGRSALAFAVLAIGALFALYGQTYQTGADPWQLFALWAVCALPLVWLVHAAPLWLFWVVLVDLAVLRWLSIHIDDWYWLKDSAWPLWALALLHGTALAAAEQVWRGTPRWTRQVLYLATLAPLAATAFFGVIGLTDEGLIAVMVWLLFGAASGWWYRERQFDVVALAALALSAVVLVTTAVARLLDDYDNPLVWLLLAGISIGLTTYAGGWLLKQVRRHRAAGLTP